LVLGITIGYRALFQDKGTASVSTVENSKSVNQENTQSAKLALKKAVLEALPEMRQAKTDWERSLILRNHVYSGNKVSLPKAEQPVPLTVEKYKAVVSGQSPQLCGGMALTYIGLLQSFDIPAHLSYLATDEAINRSKAASQKSAKPLDTHATVEVFLGSHWVLQDPTFNIQWELEGKPLSILELRQAFLSGQKPTPVTNGYKLLPKRSLQEYYISYQELLGHVEISEFEVLNPQTAGSRKVVATMPPGPSWLYSVETSPLVPASKNEAGTVVRNWDFIEGLPKGWGTLPAAKVSKNQEKKAISVTTDASNSHYQIWSGNEELPPGNYQVRVKGAVLDGGMSIGVLNVTSNKWITTTRYWQGQRDRFSNSDMIVKFSLTEKQPVQIILTNWSYEQDSSIWTVEKVTIAKDKSTNPKQ
jgi:hypothetical protein